MRRLAMAALALAALAAPAAAQYDDDEDDYVPRYRRPPIERHYEPYGRGYYGRPRIRYGTMCATSRGSCPVGRPLPHNTPCGCHIPGFGFKRGAVY